MDIKGRKNTNQDVRTRRGGGNGETGEAEENRWGDEIDQLIATFSTYSTKFWSRDAVVGKAWVVEERLFELLEMEEHEISLRGPVGVNCWEDVALLLLRLIDSRKKDFCEMPLNIDDWIAPGRVVDYESSMRILTRLEEWNAGKGNLYPKLPKTLQYVKWHRAFAKGQEECLNMLKGVIRTGATEYRELTAALLDFLELSGAYGDALERIRSFVRDPWMREAVEQEMDWLFGKKVAEIAASMKYWEITIRKREVAGPTSLEDVLTRLESGEICHNGAIDGIQELWKAQKKETIDGPVSGASGILSKLEKTEVPLEQAIREICAILGLRDEANKQEVRGIATQMVEGKIEYHAAAFKFGILMNPLAEAGKRQLLESAAKSIINRLEGHSICYGIREGMVRVLSWMSGFIHDVRLLKQMKSFGANIEGWWISECEEKAMKAAGISKPVCGKRGRNLRVRVDTDSGRQMWVSHRKKGRGPRQTQREKRNPGRIKRGGA